MRLPMKMYLIIFIGASVIVYQYHMSNAWVLPLNSSQDIREMYAFKNEKDKNLSHIADDISRPSATIISVTCINSPLERKHKPDLPPLYIITPTYRRPEQLAELTRLSHTLMLVPNLHWLVIEDADKKTPLVSALLKKSGLSYDHLVAPMPDQYKKKKKGPKPRGVSNRNKGLQWLRSHAKTGVFYFADDDNTYDLDIFHEMRFTNKVSMFPVGLITKLGVSSPVIKNGSFVGFYDGWIANRKFPVDMAGFAVSIKFLLQRPKASMPFKPGYEEDGFLKSLEPFEPKEIELLAANCTKILVWHTQSKKNEPSLPVDISKYNNTNIIMLKKIIV